MVILITSGDSVVGCDRIAGDLSIKRVTGLEPATFSLGVSVD